MEGTQHQPACGGQPVGVAAAPPPVQQQPVEDDADADGDGEHDPHRRLTSRTGSRRRLVAVLEDEDDGEDAEDDERDQRRRDPRTSVLDVALVTPSLVHAASLSHRLRRAVGTDRQWSGRTPDEDGGLLAEVGRHVVAVAVGDRVPVVGDVLGGQVGL